jgi:hypothetical protein
MTYCLLRKRKIRAKEHGSPVALSLRSDGSYNGVLQKEINTKADGARLPGTVKGIPWAPEEYIHKHGKFPSKTRLYIVQEVIM